MYLLSIKLLYMFAKYFSPKGSITIEILKRIHFVIQVQEHGHQEKKTFFKVI